MNFKNVISNFSTVPKSNTKYAGNIKCEDAVWGKIIQGIVSNHPRSEIDGKRFPQCKMEENNVIIIVAESPHTAEYSFNKNAIDFKSPLHRSDNKIIRKLKNLINLWIDKSKNYDVVLVNAIQYQCSFGLPLWKSNENKLQKNDVFKYAWDKEKGKQDLLDRINSIINNKQDVIIINACTIRLKVECNSSIFHGKQNNNSFKVYDTNHPSKW